MKKPLYIFLLFALLPAAGFAREETLEERKKRIVRKYLRERAEITQSDMVVPSDLPEDERITESEKFQDAEIDLERHEDGGAPIMPPPPQRRPIPQAEANWLLGESEELETDMFGNPVDSFVDNGDDIWSPWDGGREDRTEQSARRDRRDLQYDSYIREQEGMRSGEQQFSSQDPRSRASTSFGRDLFGRPQAETERYNNSGFGLQQQPRTYGASPDQGLLTSPFPQVNSSSRIREDEGEPETRSPTGYQPYKSPYQQRSDRSREQQQWGTPPVQQQEDFRRPNTYEQWKERNRAYDPTADDAYINQMLDQNR